MTASRRRDFAGEGPFDSPPRWARSGQAKICATQSFHWKILVHREALRRFAIGRAGVAGGDGEAAVSVAGAVGVKTAAVAAHQQIAGRAQVVERGVVALAG